MIYGLFTSTGHHTNSTLSIATIYQTIKIISLSLQGRSIVIRNAANEINWICGSIGYPGKLLTAITTFYFPVHGQVVLRQELDKPYGETTVLVELSYSDGQLNNTANHNWILHENFAGRDFYNWSRRCDSTGSIYNPIKIGQFKYTQKSVFWS